MQPQNDYPQMLLRQAAQQFIFDLQSAGHNEAAQYLKNKYLGYQSEAQRIQYVPQQTQQVRSVEQLLNG